MVKPSDQFVTQIDLFKIHHFDNRARSTSLKVLEFNMRSDSIEDLPFPVGTVLNPEQIKVLKEYNQHDVAQTKAFYHHTLDMIHFREELTHKYQRDFMNHNDTTISQSTITLKKGLVRDQICVHGFEDYFTAQGLTAGQHYTGIGAFEAGILMDVAKKTAKAIGNEMWNGGSNWITSGLTDLLYAANMGSSILGSTTPTSGGSAGTDAAGVYNICEALLNAAMADVDFASDVMAGNCHIVMSPKEYAFLQQNYVKLNGQNLITPGLNVLQNGSFAEFNFPGFPVPVVVQNFLTGTGTIILSRNGNLVAALDLESDFTDIKLGMDQYEEFIWWKFRFKGGVGYRDLTGNSIKYWGPTT